MPVCFACNFSSLGSKFLFVLRSLAQKLSPLAGFVLMRSESELPPLLFMVFTWYIQGRTTLFPSASPARSLAPGPQGTGWMNKSRFLPSLLTLPLEPQVSLLK